MRIKTFRGDDLTLNLLFKDGSSPIDITDWTVFFTIKKNADDVDADAVLTKDVTSHSDPTNGITEIVLLDTETDEIEGVFDYDIQTKDDSGIIKTIVRGVIEFEKDITRRIS